jgi:hypothetical protein
MQVSSASRLATLDQKLSTTKDTSKPESSTLLKQLVTVEHVEHLADLLAISADSAAATAVVEQVVLLVDASSVAVVLELAVLDFAVWLCLAESRVR